MTWDIRPGREEEYFEFVVREYIPNIQELGLALSDAWLTVYGDQPRIMAEAKMPSLKALQRVLNNAEWEDLTRRLLDFVDNFSYKIVPARRGFQM